MDNSLSNLEVRMKYFSNSILKFNPPAPEDAISLAESKLGIKFCTQYRKFLHWHNGGRIIEVHLYGVQLVGTKLISKDLDIVARNLSNRSFEWWQQNWLELGIDGFGNYFVADLTHRNVLGENTILFVDHETLGGDTITSLRATSYFEFLYSILDEMIQIYDSNGNLKSD